MAAKKQKKSSKSASAKPARRKGAPKRTAAKARPAAKKAAPPGSGEIVYTDLRRAMASALLARLR